MSNPTEITSVEKFTDLSVATLAPGGKLEPEYSASFIEKLFDDPGLLQDVRRVTMNADTMNINKIALGGPIVKAANVGTPPYRVDGAGETYSDNRTLPSAERFAPTFEQVQLFAREYIAEILITDDIVENIMGKENAIDQINAMAARRVRLEMEQHALSGDTTLSTANQNALAVQDGWLKRAIAGNVVNAGGSKINVDIFGSAIKAVPTPYRVDQNNMNFYMHSDKEIDWRLGLAGRGTSLGDRLISEAATVPALGRPLKAVNTMPVAQGLFVNPKNLIVGFQRDIRLETERFPRSRATSYIWTYKAAFQIEEVAGIVLINNIG